MKSAKQPIDPLARNAFAFERDQVVGRLFDEFAGFGDELLLERFIAVSP